MDLPINDILSSECTLFTMISILIGLWYEKICAAIDACKAIKQREDNPEEISRLWNVFWTKILLLLCLVLLTFFIYLPPVIDVAKKYLTEEFVFNPIELSACAIELINAFFCIYFFVLTVEALRLLHKK